MLALEKSIVDPLKASLSSSSSIVTPDSENYDQSYKRWSEASEKKPAIIVYPITANDVSAAILFSRTHSLDIATVCGGHSTGGSSSTTGGLVIDLSRMRSVTVDPAKRTITAQGGALWSDVDAAGATHGLATVGGTVNHTGIGGLTLGGGIGWLSCAYGLAIDNLLEVEIVLADGKVVRASEAENEDLFWAVRGAGACFGVVTEFVYKAHEQKNAVYGGLLVFPPPMIAQVFDFANRQMENHDGKHGMVVAFGCPPPAFQPVVLTGVFYNGTEEEAKRFFAPLLKLGPLVDHTGMMPYPAINTIFNPVTMHGDRKTWKGSAYLCPLDQKVAEETFNEFATFVQKVPDAAQSVLIFEYFSADQVVKVPQRATAYANRASYCNILIGPRWAQEANDSICRGWARELAAKFTTRFEEDKKKRDVDKMTQEAVGQYGNYDGLGNTARAVFGVNTERLVALKKQYDPQNLFNKWIDLLAPETAAAAAK